MQIQVINTTRNRTSADVVGAVIAGLKQTPDGLPMAHADAYAADGLVGILEVRAIRGEREILVMECSRAHVQGVLKWNACNEKRLFEDLIIHMVRINNYEDSQGNDQ